jgi:PTH1 family peptidyl-tRNA hydrolase
MLLVVGLGNPGPKYAAHRHNVGFMTVDELARRVGADPFRDKFSGQCARASIGGQPAVLLKPMTFMNESGQSVQAAAAFFKVEPADVCVVHDELDLPFGAVRLKLGGGHAGHNGLRSMVTHLGTSEFARVRVGIGRPPPGFRADVADYVLSSFDAAEAAALPPMLTQASDAIVDIARRGLAAAMNARNVRPRPPKPPREPQPTPQAEAGPPAARSEPPPRDGEPHS